MLFQTSIITYAIQRPSSKFVPQSIIDTIPNTNENLRYPAPSSNLSPKYYWCRSKTSIITYAVPAPILKLYLQKVFLVLFPIPIKLTLSSALLETLFQKYYWYIPNTNKNLRCPSAHLKSYLQKFTFQIMSNQSLNIE